MQLRRGPRATVLCIYVELSSMDGLRANCITMKQAKIQNVFNSGTRELPFQTRFPVHPPRCPFTNPMGALAAVPNAAPHLLFFACSSRWR